MVTKKKKIIVNTIVALIFFALIGWVAIGLNENSKKTSQNNQTTSQVDEWNRIKKTKQITIDLDDTFVPMGFRDKNGKLIGFDVDLANAVFKTMGITVKWQPIDWSMKETEKQVAFSETYHNATQVLVTLKKNNINHFTDMKDKVLGDQTASSGDEGFSKYPKVLKQYVKDQKVVGYDTFDKAFNDLNAGRIDGLLIDEDYARYYVAHQPNPKNYTITVGDFPVDQTGVGFRKSDNGLRRAVNKTLAAFKADGRMNEIEDKWFSK